jgi:hypothetical protein
MSVEFILYVVGLVGVSYYIGHQHGLRAGVIDAVDQMIVMKLLSKKEIDSKKEEEDKK